MLGVWNGLRALFNDRKRDLLFIGIGGGVLSIYGWIWAKTILRQNMTIVSLYWSSIVIILGVAVFSLGMVAGGLAARRSVHSLACPWLSVLPWSRTEQKRAVVVSVFITGAVQTIMVWLGLWLALAQLKIVNPMIISAGNTALFFTGISLSAGIVLTRPAPSRLASRGPLPRHLLKAHFDGVIGRLDRASPRWTGWWSVALRLGLIIIVWLGSLVVLGVAGAAASFELHTGIPLLAAGIIGGNISFISSFRCDPLVSPVLRTQPLSYFRSWIAVIRLPMVISFAWFLLPALVALVISKADLPPVLIAASLLCSLNILFAATSASVPYSPRLAACFYTISLAWAAYEYGQLRSLVFIVLAGIMLLFWIRARRRFRAYG